MGGFADPALKPMLIRREAGPFDDPDYAFELKLDGGRCLAYLDGSGTILANKRLVRVLPQFPELAGLHREVAGGCVLDGEILVLGPDGRPDFYEYNRRAGMSRPLKIALAAKDRPAVFVAYDLLDLRGRDLTRCPLLERQARLREVVRESARLSVARSVPGQGKAFFRLVAAKGLEGLVGKRRDGLYLPGRYSPDWVKIKNLLDDDFVICGYLGAAPGPASLVLGQYNPQGGLVYKGRVTLNPAGDDFALIAAQRKAKVHPFAADPPPGNARAVWLEPALVCVVKFMGRTGKGGLRQPVYKGLRLDKAAKEAREAEPGQGAAGAEAAKGAAQAAGAE